DIRHEFPDAWEAFRSARPRADEDEEEDEHREKPLRLRLTRRMFPFVPGGREVWIDKVAVVFGTSCGRPCGCPDSSGCPCPRAHLRAEREIDFVQGHGDDNRDDRGHRDDRDDRDGHDPDGPDGEREAEDDDREETDVRCFAAGECPGWYCGIVDT